MIEIDRKTGTVKWEEFTLHSKISHEDILNDYPQIELLEDYFIHSGLRTRLYKSPTFAFNNYAVNCEVTYENNRLQSIRFGKGGFYEIEEHFETPQLAEWGISAYNWLKTSFGEPHEIHAITIPNEEELLTEDESPLLEMWIYKSEWGSYGFEYNPIEMYAYIFVHYESKQQLSDWNMLIEECDFQIQSEQQRHGKYVPHLRATRFLLDALSPHFEFHEVNPSIFNGRIGFSSSDGAKKALIDVRPNTPTKMYKIWQHDTHKSSVLAEGDYPRLIAELRKFLEIETL